MKSVIFSSLLVSAFAVKCYWQSPSYKLDKDGAIIDLYIDWPGIGFKRPRECGLGLATDAWACASTKFEGSFTKKEKNWLTGKEYDSSWTYESETKGCTADAVCDKLAGGENGCQKATYTYEKWIPTSCNADEDYHAIKEDFSTSLTLSCCNTDYCNQNEDYGNCVEAGPFSKYISALNTCWNDYKRTFMTELLCDNDGKPNRDILSFGQNCTEEDGSWRQSKRREAACAYRPTCAAEMRDVLKEFGECACKAASDHGGYSGDFIGTAMQNNWQRFCPNLQLSCAADTGVVELLYKYFLIRYKFKVALAKSLIDDAKIAKIKAKIAEYLNVSPVTITITFDDTPPSSSTSTTTRRLLQDETAMKVTIQADDENTKEYVETNMNTALANELTSATGADVTMTSVDTEEGSEATKGSYNGCNTFNVSIILLLVVMAAILN